MADGKSGTPDGNRFCWDAFAGRNVAPASSCNEIQFCSGFHSEYAKDDSANGSAFDSLLVNTDLNEALTTLAENAVNADLPAWLDEIETMRENFAVNINRKIATDALFVSMAGR